MVLLKLFKSFFVCSASELHITVDLVDIVCFTRFYFHYEDDFFNFDNFFFYNFFHVKILELGLCTDYGKINSVIVLAGDPEQLDAVTKSKNAKKFGYKNSLMAYLQKNKICYMQGSHTHDMVQLTKNYRSHPSILKIPNERFYENRIEAQSRTGELKK